MKQPTPSPRASHVNFGTSVPHDELPWPEHAGPVMGNPKLHLEADQRSVATRFGGLSLAEQFCRRFKVAELIDKHVDVLKIHLPYHESDHVLAQAFNLFVGGTCLEDMMNLQGDEAVLRMLGACRLPDPTTGGDFLRRFDSERNPDALPGLRQAGDELQDSVWRKLSRRERRRRKRDWAIIDIDGHIKELSGIQKEGADFSYNGKWSYQPLFVSLAGTGECLAVRNRPGNVRSSDGAAQLVAEQLPRIKGHFCDVLVRADSDFDRQDLREACEQNGAYFAFVGRAHTGRPEAAMRLPDESYQPYRSRAQRLRDEQRRKGKRRPGAHKPDRRRQRARSRGYKEKLLIEQQIAETTYQPHGSEKCYRLIVRRQLIEYREGQQYMFHDYRYRYVVTNLPASVHAEQVIDYTYQRCDQENLIEQMGSGLAGWRMPVAEFDGNAAWLEIARLAWNMAKWIAQLVLPAEVTRWEWKRFRLRYVYVAAQVIKRSRQMWVRLLGPPSETAPLLRAFDAL